MGGNLYDNFLYQLYWSHAKMVIICGGHVIAISTLLNVECSEFLFACIEAQVCYFVST